jgi:hypothetical protein
MLDMHNGAVVVPATLNGTQQELLIDTAGIRSGVFEDTASALGLRPARVVRGPRIYDARRDRLDELVMISQLGLGDMHGSNLWFVEWPRGKKPGTVGGLLAPDILRNYDVDFDFAAGKLKLFSPDHCAGRVVYWATSWVVIPFLLTPGAHIEIPVTLDDQSLDAVVDTGAPVTLLSQARATRLFHIHPDSPSIERAPATRPGELGPYRTRFKSLSFEGVVVANPLIYLMPDAAEHSMTVDEGKLANHPELGSMTDVPHFILGLDVLCKLHLYIAWREQKLYLTAADAVAIARPGNGSAR